jgi:protein TonB
MIVIRTDQGHAAPDASQDHVADLSDAVLRLRSRDEAAPESEFDFSNVVPFARGRREHSAAPPISVSPADRFFSTLTSNRERFAALVVCSIAAHAALYLPFMREPEPMSSIGEIAITAEIVLGANTPAGNAAQTGDAEASAPTPAQDPNPQPDGKPEPELAQTEPPKPEAEVAKPEPQPPEPRRAEAPQTQRVAELPPPEEQPSIKPHAPVEPVPDVQEAPAEIQAAPQEPAAAELQAAVRPEMAVEFKQAPAIAKPAPMKPAEARKPVARPETPRREERRVASRGERNESRSTAPASSAASGVGRGRSDLSSNYRGLVAAHLARFKQFPADARSRGDTGSAAVAFSLSGGGGVTSVRLVRGTGVGSLDQEATAMVRRASPFPAPPDGRAVSFTVPVSFRIR